MSQLTENSKKIEEVAIRLLSGVLSNPNYNFDNVKKAVAHAIDHARELVVRVAEAIESEAKKVAVVADKIGDKARGSDDDKPKAPVAPVVDKPKDPLSDI